MAAAASTGRPRVKWKQKSIARLLNFEMFFRSHDCGEISQGKRIKTRKYVNFAVGTFSKHTKF